MLSSYLVLDNIDQKDCNDRDRNLGVRSGQLRLDLKKKAPLTNFSFFKLYTISAFIKKDKSVKSLW